MAFIDFNATAAGGATMSRLLPVARADEQAELSALEWQIVALARGDRLGSLRQPGRWSRMLALLFGARPNPRLADPRLEAFRRLAVFAWHHGFAVPVSATAAALDAGYTVAQIELALAHIGAARLRVTPASRASRMTIPRRLA